jgi:hypothetical protein
LSKRTLIVLAGFAAVVVLAAGIAQLLSPYFVDQESECAAQCKGQGLTGAIVGVQVASPQKPGIYITEWRCSCK